MLLHLLVHRKLNICHFLLRMSANFKTVWWFFTSLGKPKFDIVSFLPEHFIWGLMPYLSTVYISSFLMRKNNQVLWRNTSASLVPSIMLINWCMKFDPQIFVSPCKLTQTYNQMFIICFFHSKMASIKYVTLAISFF